MKEGINQRFTQPPPSLSLGSGRASGRRRCRRRRATFLRTSPRTTMTTRVGTGFDRCWLYVDLPLVWDFNSRATVKSLALKMNAQISPLNIINIICIGVKSQAIYPKLRFKLRGESGGLLLERGRKGRDSREDTNNQQRGRGGCHNE